MYTYHFKKYCWIFSLIGATRKFSLLCLFPILSFLVTLHIPLSMYVSATCSFTASFFFVAHSTSYSIVGPVTAGFFQKRQRIVSYPILYYYYFVKSMSLLYPSLVTVICITYLGIIDGRSNCCLVELPL